LGDKEERLGKWCSTLLSPLSSFSLLPPLPLPLLLLLLLLLLELVGRWNGEEDLEEGGEEEGEEKEDGEKRGWVEDVPSLVLLLVLPLLHLDLDLDLDLDLLELALLLGLLEVVKDLLVEREREEEGE